MVKNIANIFSKYVLKKTKHVRSIRNITIFHYLHIANTHSSFLGFLK